MLGTYTILARLKFIARGLAIGGLFLLTPYHHARAAGSDVLIVGDQRGGAKAVMEAAGVLNDMPYRLQWSIFAAAAPLLEALNANAIDLGLVGDAPFTFALAAGTSIKAIAAERTDGGSTAILVAEKAPFRSVADLKGKIVGTGRGSIGHFLLLKALESAGLKPDDVKLAFLSPADAKAALEAGSIDAWVSWGQYVPLAVIEGGDRVLLDGRGLLTGLGYEAASDQAVATKRPLLLDYLRRLDQAWRWAAQHPAAYAEVWARETGVSLPVSQATLVHYMPVPTIIDDGVIAEQQGTLDAYVKAGVISRHADARSGFDPSFNTAVAPP